MVKPGIAGSNDIQTGKRSSLSNTAKATIQVSGGAQMKRKANSFCSNQVNYKKDQAMTTTSKTASVQSGDMQLAAATYQQSMQGLTAVVTEKATESGVVVLKPGELSVVQVQAGKQYKLRKSGNLAQTPDNLIAVRHADALHVRYADGSVVHFEGFYSTCTSANVCSVSLAGNSVAGTTLSGDMASAGAVADDGLMVYAHGDSETLMSMAQDQSSLLSALRSADVGGTLTYLAPSALLGAGLFALAAVGGAVAAAATTATASVLPVAVTLEESNAWKKIGAAAEANNASGTASPAVAALTLDDYSKAKVTGVNAGNISAINSALDSAAITGAKADSKVEIQAIVDAYNAILASADGAPGNTSTSLTGEQYAAVGITGIGSGVPTDGSALKLLDELVDKSAATDVNTVAKLQAKADAVNHLLTAAGGTDADAAKLTLADLVALGITNVTAENIDAVRAAIKNTTPDSSIDQLSEVKSIVDTAVVGVATELAKISKAADANNASTTVTVDDYIKASVTGVNAGNLAAINSALDSAAIAGTQADTRAELQSIVDAYNAILASADGTAANTIIALNGERYTAVGVTGVASGAPTAGSVLSLLNSTVDASQQTAVNTVASLQKLADAAAHVMTAAGQTTGAVTLTGADLTALGITGLTASNTQAVINAIVAQTSDANVDTLAELQAIATTAQTKAATALSSIATAAHNNTAVSQSLAASVYIDAGVAGLTAANTTLLGAVNSALDSTAVDTAQVSTTAAVQNIVNDYSAILASADGTAGNTTTALTGNQYADVGVTGVSGAAAPVAGTNLFLMDSVVDAKSAAAVDTVAELQAIANAATDVMAAANQGTTNVTAAQLSALGITGDFSVQSTLDAINVAIHNAATTGVDTQGELQTLANAAAHPGLNSALNSVTNLDVTSNLVFTSTSAVKLGTTGFIHITQTGGTGYGGEAAAGNSQDIDISTAIGKGMISIDATGTKITINPTWDLDLGATYSISIDAGAFVSTAAGNQASAAVSGITFSTVTPGTHTAGNTTIATDAHASQMMDSSGALVAGKSWLDIGGLGDNTGGVSLLGSLQSGAYALVMKNYATTPADAAKGFNGIKAHDTNVSVTDFGADDLIYFDAQANNAAIQKFDPLYTNLINGFGHGGVAGQTAMELGLVTNPTQKGSSAQILMGFLNNTSNQIFASVYTSADGSDLGFGTFLGSQPVLMG